MSTTNPFDTATQVGKEGLPPATDTYYGEVEITAQYIKLIKGQGKQVWNDQVDDVKERRTEISINLIALAEMKLQYPMQRAIIAESREWTDIVWPSIAACGLDNAGLLHGKFVKAQLVENGRTWTRKDGSTAKGTSLKFLAIYPNKKACEDAYYADLGNSGGSDDSTPFDTSGTGGTNAHSTPTNGNGADANPERAVAAQFLGVLVKQAGADRNKLATLIASAPVVSKYFSVDSPEVAALAAA